MSKRKKIHVEEKIRIARACSSGEISISAAAAQIGVDHHTVSDWVRKYQTEGIEEFLPRNTNKRYDPALKEGAVKDYLSGKGSIREICKIYKIRSTHQLRSWIRCIMVIKTSRNRQEEAV